MAAAEIVEAGHPHEDNKTIWLDEHVCRLASSVRRPVCWHH